MLDTKNLLSPFTGRASSQADFYSQGAGQLPAIGGGVGLGGLLGFLGKTAASSNPLTAAALQFGLPLAKELAPMIGGALFGNPEAERAAQLREQSLSAIKGILPAAQNLAKGELPQATIDAVEGAADRSRQASAMSAMRAGQYGSSVGRAQQQQASEQVQDTLARQSLAAQQAGVTQVSGLANQLGLMGQQYAASGNLVDKQRGLLAGRIAEALGEPDEDLKV